VKGEETVDLSVSCEKKLLRVVPGELLRANGGRVEKIRR